MTITSSLRSFITFKLGDELFAITVSGVREVLELPSITRVPTAPSYMRGVANVRGGAVPVLDLRRKFGLAGRPDTASTRLIVFEIEIEGELAVVGGVADSVHEVLELDLAGLKDPPRIAMRWRAEMIEGLAKKGDEFVIVLDAARVFAADDSLLASSEPRRDALAS